MKSVGSWMMPGGVYKVYHDGACMDPGFRV